MTTDVNVTEKVAQALCPSLWDDTYPEHLREGLRHLAREHATAALSALSDPEVLAGMAGVLQADLAAEGGEPGSSLHSWRCEYPDRYGPCDCLAVVSASQAAAVVEWLSGQG